MYFFLILIMCYFISTVYVNGKEKMRRFVVEENVKPAIFGSYSYNALSKTFEIKDYTASSQSNLIQIQIFNRTITQVHSNTNPQPPVRLLRKLVTMAMPKQAKTFNWKPSSLRNRANSNPKMSTTKLVRGSSKKT